jgi:hypothetical protein
MVSFLLAIVFDQLTLIRFAEYTSQFGSITLLSAFFVLLLAGLGMIASLINASISSYFSTRRRLERRLLFYFNRRNNLNQLFHSKKIRLFYINQQKRKQLLAKNDRKMLKLAPNIKLTKKSYSGSNKSVPS